MRGSRSGAFAIGCALAPWITLFAACSTPANPEPTVGVGPATTSAGSDDRAEFEPKARLAYIQDQSVCLQTLGPDAFGPRRCAEMKYRPVQIVWITDREVAVLLASSAVQIVGPQGTRDLEEPPPTAWLLPEPRGPSGQPLMSVAATSDKMHLYLSGGALWLAKCPWSIAGRCHQWATVKLRTPNPTQEVLSGDPPGFSDAGDPDFAGAAPAGVTISRDTGAPAADTSWVVRWSDREIGKIRGSAPVFAPAEATATPPARTP